jgi:predicted RNA-binding Zn-ribbon protein involved in translation (DUF1610 family)
MKISELPISGLVGGLTTDYFDFWCENCGEHIDRLDFHSQDVVGVRLQAVCEKCGREFVFKIKVSPPLGPVSF